MSCCVASSGRSWSDSLASSSCGSRAADQDDPGVAPRAAPVALVGAGVIHGMFSTGGPLVVWALGRSLTGKRAFRATLACVWMVLATTLTLAYTANDRIDAGTLRATTTLVPVLAVALSVGEWAHHRLDERRFRVVRLRATARRWPEQLALRRRSTVPGHPARPTAHPGRRSGLLPLEDAAVCGRAGAVQRARAVVRREGERARQPRWACIRAPRPTCSTAWSRWAFSSAMEAAPAPSTATRPAHGSLPRPRQAKLRRAASWR